jgi:hypothetical protein
MNNNVKALVERIEPKSVKSREKAVKLKPHHAAIRAKLAQGLQESAIITELGVTKAQVRYVRERYPVVTESDNLQSIQNNAEIYNQSIAERYKDIAVRVGNTITDKDIKKMSVAQRVTVMGICTDKSRLIEGKSTENQAVAIMHNINPEQLEAINSVIRSLKKSMLSS